MAETEFIHRDQLTKGGVYALRSRNLFAGVYDGVESFIGIREKFGHKDLDAEYLAREQGGTQLGIDTAVTMTALLIAIVAGLFFGDFLVPPRRKL